MPDYCRIVVALDGSPCSNLAADAGAVLASKLPGVSLSGCHVYAAKLHRNRFGEMEPGLPNQYQSSETLGSLRATHDDLISSGMKLIADAYIAPLAKKVQGTGISFSYLTPEGKHYQQLLRVLEDDVDLAIIGAHGLGKVPESCLGSVAERVVLHAGRTDVLVMREPWDPTKPIIVGIDGSMSGYAALARAIEIANVFGTPVEAVAVFDPDFHTSVFHTLAGVLPKESQKKFNFPAQEEHHDRIIDCGLERLYRGKLEQAREFAESRGFGIATSVLKGKVFPEIIRHSRERGAGMIALGRFGLHHEEPVLIGSHALNVARLATGNVLIVSAPPDPLPVPGMSAKRPGRIDVASFREGGDTLPWTPEAEELLRKVPLFAQGMARMSIEDRVRSAGGMIVTPDAVRDRGSELGMGSDHGSRVAMVQGRGYGSSPVQPAPVADLVVFRKVKRFAPDFHRHMVSSKIPGMVLKKGDRMLVYEVDETQPDGPVSVSEKTRIEFR